MSVVAASETEVLSWPYLYIEHPEVPMTPERIRFLAAEARNMMNTSPSALSSTERIELFSKWALKWRNPLSAWRRRARAALPVETGLSRPMVEAVLDLFFQPLKKEMLATFCEKLPSKERELVGHVVPGNVLAAAAESWLLELLAGHMNMVKLASGCEAFPILLVESLRELDPRLVTGISLLSWRSGEERMESAFALSVDRLIVYGRQSTVDAYRRLAGAMTHLEIFGPGFSIGAIGRDACNRKNMAQLASRAAIDVSLYDQRGCLSLQRIFVQSGGEVAPHEFVAILAEAMGEVSNDYPLGRLTIQESASVRYRRQLWRMRKLAGATVAQLFNEKQGWTVQFDNDVPNLHEGLTGRVVVVHPFKDYDELEQLLIPYRGLMLGVAVSDVWKEGFWKRLSLRRIAEFGSLHLAPLGWQSMASVL